MDLKEQKYVCALAECKSLTRASERLYISQPALSLYINNVEKNLGAPLFERNGRKFELTWLGKQYVEKASQMLELERQFEAVRRQAERENAALPEEEEKQKKPAGSKAADAAPTELVLPQREARTGSPVRYILIGALLAGALCIAIYLFTHPAREDDPADETKS